MYPDSEGNPTVGIGVNLNREGARESLEAVGADYDKVRSGAQDLTADQISSLLEKDICTAMAAARRKVSNFDDLPGDAQSIVVDMVFNMGESRFAGFKEMIKALEARNWRKAADEMHNSRFQKKLSNREGALEKILRGITEK